MGELHEACGVFGIYAPGVDVARITFFGLYALQHRGQESAGITTGDGKELRTFKAMGLVVQVFNEEELSFLKGHVAIGHTRYSTTGSSKVCNAQPIVVDCDLTAKAAAAAPGLDWETRIRHSLHRFQGAYCLVMATPTTLYAARDPLGVRPLCLGRLNGGWVVASETCALDTVGAEFVREVEPGELVVINGNGMRSVQVFENQRRAMCIFEFIYFARPDSEIAGESVHLARQELGRHLAREYPVDADLVIPVPDSAIPAATAYAQVSGIPFGEGLIKNRYIVRTFIQPDQRLRQVGVRLKFNPLPRV